MDGPGSFPEIVEIVEIVGDPHEAHVERLDQVRPHRLIEIRHFFDTYKLLESKETEVLGWRDAEDARRLLLADRERYLGEIADRSLPA
jgi:inorganic pyrophosphatase